MRRHLAPLAAIALLAGCAAPRLVPEAARPAASAPAAVPAPRPAQTTAPAPAPAPARGWEDGAVTPGRWAYVPDTAGTSARFIAANGGELASLRCDLASRRVTLARADLPANAPLIVRTSFGDLAWSIAPRLPTDPGLDWIAFSRGRFALESGGGARLVLPAWAEVARVIEDCRG